MNIVIDEGSLRFLFETNVKASKYDAWKHYRNQFQNKCYTDNKAVDIIAHNNQKAWLCEIKDFRTGIRSPDKPPLEQEIAQKVRDSLAGLVSAKFCANDSTERNFAHDVLQCHQIHIILHIEQPSNKQIYDLSDLRDKLKRLLKAIDPHVLVMNQNTLSHYKNKVSWQVSNI